MARTLDDVMATLPAERQKRIRRRAADLLAEVDGLVEVRKLAGKTQAQIADALGKTQPSVQKMEKQADYYVSTLRRFVEAAGGTVEIRVNLPGKPPLKLREFADLNPSK